MRVKDPVEILYLSLMERWEDSAPTDGHGGILDGSPALNTQVARMARVLNFICSDATEAGYRHLACKWRRANGSPLLAKDPTGMTNPHALAKGWWLEGCLSLDQKTALMQDLTGLGLSPVFVRSASEFVRGATIKGYFPTPEEEQEIIARIESEASRTEL